MKSTTLAILGAASLSSANANDMIFDKVQEASEQFLGPSGSLWKTCPKTTVVSDFDLNRYLGTWYELARQKNNDQGDSDCGRAIYDYNHAGNIGVHNSGIHPGKPRDGVTGEAKAVDPSAKDGHLEVSFFWWMPFTPYDILYTDYENIAVVHTCLSYGFGLREEQWVIHRKPLNKEANSDEYNAAIEKAKSVLESQLPGFNWDEKMRITRQGEAEGCTY